MEKAVAKAARRALEVILLLLLFFVDLLTIDIHRKQNQRVRKFKNQQLSTSSNNQQQQRRRHCQQCQQINTLVKKFFYIRSIRRHKEKRPGHNPPPTGTNKPSIATDAEHGET